MIKPDEIVAVIPAAGRATRLGTLPCSKEILPTGAGAQFINKGQIRVVAHHVLECLFQGGIKECFIILEPSKADIPRYLKNNAGIEGFNIAYRYIDNSANTPTTLNVAFPFVMDRWVALGFPDMVLPDREIFTRLINQLDKGVDVLMGLFPATQPQCVDMVDVDKDGRVRGIEVKPTATLLQKTWGIAIWSPKFSRFMYEYCQSSDRVSASRELFVGDIIIAAINKGLCVKAVDVSAIPYLDIGSVENYSQLFTNNS